MNILGLAAKTHDAGIALLRDGVLDFVFEEERFNREKHTKVFPDLAIADAIKRGWLDFQNVDCITTPWHVYELRLSVRQLLLRRFPLSLQLLLPGNAGPQDPSIVFINWIIQSHVRKLTGQRHVPEIVQVPHHDAHAGWYFASPFDEAAVLIMDGYGDQSSTSFYHGRGDQLENQWRNWLPDSMGILYSLVTEYLGFPKFGDEGKVMGLSALGSPKYAKAFEKLVHLKPDGAYELNREYFAFATHGRRKAMTRKFYDEFGPRLESSSPLTERHMDLAYALQHLCEQVVLHVVRHLESQTKSKKLCFFGGVGLNCVATAKILDETGFDEVWMSPAAGDTGAPAGSALWHYHQTLGNPRTGEITHAYYGRDYTDAEIETSLRQAGLRYERFDRDDLISVAANHIADGNIIGWFQGACEMGARALGNRSILADPRRADMKDRINAKIKYREAFRPFAPAVLQERCQDFFDVDQPDPFMTLAPRVHEHARDKIPAVVHVDGTARIQTVARDANDRYYDLIARFGEITGIPVLLNTSFNKQEPIVAHPDHAISCFLRTDMDVLVIGNYVVTEKSKNAVEQAKVAFAQAA